MSLNASLENSGPTSEPAAAPVRDDDVLLTVPQVANRLQVHVEVIRRWVRKGAMQHVRVGPGRGLIRIEESELRRHVRRGQS